MSFPFDPFAECAQLQRTECINKISYKDLGQTACNVARAVLGLDRVSLQAGDLAPWEAVAGKAAHIMDVPESEMAAREFSASALAKTLYMQYTVECGREPDWRWDEETATSKLAWEAVVRHLANLIDSDGQQNFQELEERIIEWSRRRADQIVCG